MNKEEIENWKKEFDEISYYQKVKMKDGSYILVCQNSHLIEKIRQLLKYEKEKWLEKIDEIIDDNNDLLRWQKEELKDEIRKEVKVGKINN